MSDWMFRRFLLGKTLEEIAAECREPKPSVEEVRAAILQEREKFEADCLRELVARARKGDGQAIDWLSRRGLFDQVKLPD